MDQTHSRAREALQPFIHLANSTSSSSPKLIANLITNATSNPQTYFFAELLETPTIQSLRSPDTPEEYQGYLTLLEIFSWGTWQEYQSTPNLPSLNPEQTQKLRLLSLLSLCVSIKPLTYDTLMTALSISNPSDLESLVTTAIYSSLLTARLSPVSSPPSLTVTSVAPLRDVKPQSLPQMISALDDWEARCGAVIGDIETEIANIKSRAVKERARDRSRQTMLDKALGEWAGDKGVETGSGPGSGASGGRTGRKLGGAARFGPGVGIGNKREFSADDHEDNGSWENGGDEGVDSGLASRMDVDEGAGSSRGGPGGRHAKRILGRKLERE